jgi:hypothetical protein
MVQKPSRETPPSTSGSATTKLFRLKFYRLAADPGPVFFRRPKEYIPKYSCSGRFGMEEVPATWWRCTDWWDLYGETLPEGLQALYVTFPDVNDETYTTLCIYKTDGEKPVVGPKGVTGPCSSSHSNSFHSASFFVSSAISDHQKISASPYP